MAFRSLREFLDLLEQRGELVHVKTRVDLKHELGAVCRKALDHSGPVLWFDQPGDQQVPLVANLLATRERFALALDTDPDNLHRDWLERTRDPLPPVLVSDGPCQEVVLTGEDVDLGRLPIPIWNELDGGPYITFPCQISRDPVTGIRNASMYRAQVFDRCTVGIVADPFRHLAQQRAKANPSEPFPVAIALGLDPVLHIASTACFPYGVDELAMAGALRGEPVPLVKCRTIPLEVPAEAEIILEGEIVPGEVREEGLFGEFTGYYGVLRQRPFVRIKAITHRRDPIYLGTLVGRPPQECDLMMGVPAEAEILRTVSLPGLKKVHLTRGGGGSLIGIASLTKPFEGYGKMMGLAILGTWGGRYIKLLIVVDEDIDPFNWTEVEWAMATRVQPDRDVEIVRGLTGVVLDPSLPLEERMSGKSRTDKMIIDATRYDAASFEQICMPKPEVMQKVEQNWEHYGIKL